MAGVTRTEDDEPREVLGMIGYTWRKFDQTVPHAGAGRSDCGETGVARACDLASGDAGVFTRYGARMRKTREKLPALGNDERMSEDFAYVFEGGTRSTEQAVIHSPDDLRNRNEIEFEKQIVAVTYGAGDRVIDRHDADVRPAGRNRNGGSSKTGRSKRRRVLRPGPRSEIRLQREL